MLYIYITVVYPTQDVQRGTTQKYLQDQSAN